MTDGPAHTFRYLTEGDHGDGALIALSERDTHHLVRVVRRTVGDVIELVDASGARWQAVVETLGNAATCRVVGPPVVPIPAAPIELWLGLPRWDALERITRMVTEIGVQRVVLVRSERVTRVPHAGELTRHLERLERIADDAWRQSGSPTRPTIEALIPFDELIDHVATRDATAWIALDPRAARPLSHVLAGTSSVALLLGPEAGFSPEELRQVETAGALQASLEGAGVLRVDTAAICATAVAQARGDRVRSTGE